MTVEALHHPAITRKTNTEGAAGSGQRVLQVGGDLVWGHIYTG